MKVLFSADWHIKLGQRNVPKEWQKNRFEKFFKEIYDLEPAVDIHIIGGDIFDRVPTPEELELYFSFISRVSIPTFIYDGNHEAARKGQTFLKYLEKATNGINSNVHIVDGIQEIHHIDIIPYTHLKNFDPNDFHNDILCTHVRGEIPPHVTPEIDLSLFDRWKIVLAGDLHSYENSQRNIIYPGSPMTITFHRNKVETGVIIFDTSTLKHERIIFRLPQLIRKTVKKEHEIIKTGFDHTIYEVVGNVMSLSNIDNSLEIVDKKIISKISDSKLNLKNKSLEEEIQMYLKEIHELSDEEIKETIGVFHDYFKRHMVE